MSKNYFLDRYGSKDHIDSVIDSGRVPRIESVISNPYLNSDHIDKILKTTNHTVIREELALKKDLNSHQIDKLINSSDWTVKARLIHSNGNNFSPNHIDKLVTDSNGNVRHIASSKLKLQPHHIEKLKNDDEFIRQALPLNLSLNKEHLHEFSKSNVPMNRINASKNPNLAPEDLDRLVDDPNHLVRWHVASNKRLNKDQLQRMSKRDEVLHLDIKDIADKRLEKGDHQ